MPKKKPSAALPRKTGPKETAKRKAAASSSPAENCPVVGFGASAGGLEAFTEFLEHLRPDSGMALVLIQHLDPKHSSLLTDLLSRSTMMPVEQAREGMLVQQNHVYVIPPNANLAISKHVLHLQPRLPGPHMPIDYFFRSLAMDKGSKSIGVVLSGMASDGTFGMKAIKAEGGITFAQDAASAKFDSMPRSAMAAGCVDFVLPPSRIAREIVRVCRHPYLNRTNTLEGVDDDAAFEEVFALLRSSTGVNFDLYKAGTIRRRTMRRMVIHKMTKVRDYVRYLKNNPNEVYLLFHDFLINVTGFFREPVTFDAIASTILPRLFQNRPLKDPVRIWVPGCATGEEVYSIAILILEYLRASGAEIPFQIFGTDLSEPALEKARVGIYPDSIRTDVSPERLDRFFIPINGSFQIVRSVRDACIFARQNVTEDPPFSRLDMIICRNLLIYLGHTVQSSVMRVFHYALRSHGYLVLGLSESIGGAVELFSLFDRKLRIYTRKAGPALFGAGIYARPSRGKGAGQLEEHLADRASVQRKADQLILARYSPPSVVIDRNLQILYFRGNTAPYLARPSGDAPLTLAKLTPGVLSLEVRKLLSKALAKKTLVRGNSLPIPTRNGVAAVTVVITPLQSPGFEPEFLVTIEEHPSASKKSGSRDTTPEVEELENELAGTREYLQAVIEEQEAATEELKSAHEEVQSGNEELQSTNEALVTAKEELQSTNDQMLGRNAELQQVNNDLLSLLSSVTIPIILLGNDLRIRRFTAEAEKILNLLPTDVGRPISDFRLKVSVPDLPHLCQDVIDTLVPKEREVQDRDGRSFSMSIRPYRTSESRIDGVVLSIFDLTERRHSLEARYRRLFEAAEDGIAIADGSSMEILDVNPFVTKVFGHERKRLVGQKFWESDLFRDTGLSESIVGRLKKGESVKKVLRLPSESGAPIDTEIFCNLYAEGDRKVIQFNMRDISSRRQMEDQLRAREQAARQTQKLDAVGRLAGGMADVLSNWLTAVIGYCDLLEAEKNSAASRQLLSKLREATDKAAALTKLLSFGRQHKAQPAQLDMHAVVSDMQPLIRLMLNESISLQLDIEGETGWVKADRNQVEQAVLSLVLNARDAMPQGGKLFLRVTEVDVNEDLAERIPGIRPGPYVLTTVKDTGIGMDVETQSHVFEPFFTTKAGTDGGGLGLSTPYQIVRQNDGHIAISSEPGVGTTASVYLPRVEPQPGAAENPADGKMPRGSETVLLVESEPSVRGIARRFLKRRGYNVLDAPDGPVALSVARKYSGPIHLLLTNVVMPFMSGREIAFQLEKERPKMKVLYMSGHSEDMIAHYGIPDDGAALLQKPFTQSQLAEKVREALDKNP